MDERPTTRTSRRALLAAAGGAAAGLAVDALIRPLPAAATNNSPLIVGQANTALTETSLEAQNAGVGVANALLVRNQSLPAGNYASAITALGSGQTNGIIGHSEDGHGVEGLSNTGLGVLAHSGSGTALSADNKVMFGTAGLAIVSKGKDRRVVVANIQWSPSTLHGFTKILVTLMSDPKGVAVKYVKVDPPASYGAGDHPTASSFTVYLTARAKVDTLFAYFVIS